MTSVTFRKINIKAYKPGKSFLKKKKNIIKLSANESALGMSSKALKVLQNKKINIPKYPDGKSKDLRKLQYRVVKDWMNKAKSGVIDFFDLARGFQSGDMSRAYPYEVEFLMSVLTKDKIIDRFRKYFGGKKAMNNRTASKK